MIVFSQEEGKSIESKSELSVAVSIDEDEFAKTLLETFKDPSLADSFLITHTYIVNNVSGENRAELEGMSELFDRWNTETIVIIEEFNKYSNIKVEHFELIEQKNDGVLIAYAGLITLTCDNVKRSLQVAAFQLKGVVSLGMLRDSE
jgi:hypothetical protein